MKKSSTLKRIGIIAFISVLVLQISLPVCAENKTETAKAESLSSEAEEFTYDDYYNKFFKEKTIYKTVIADSVTDFNAEKKTVEGKEAFVIDRIGNFVEFEAEIAEAGKYAVTPMYCQIGETGKNIAVSLTVDSETPFKEAFNLFLPRWWQDEVKEFKTDSSGNEIRPTQVEAPFWTSYSFRDTYGLYDKPYLLYLSSGKHRIRISYVDDEVAVNSLVLGLENTTADYDDYIKQYGKSDYAKNETVYQQAENSAYKNNSLLYPTYDRSSSAMPNDPVKIKLNTIGQTNWCNNGEKIVWKPKIENAGLYKVTFKAKQSYNYGMISYRTLRVNGVIPFKEAENIEFQYDLNWQNVTLGDGSRDFYVYLKPGDEVSLECVPGKASENLRNLQKNVNYLSSIYRQIIVITGASPDVNRDYNLSEQIPELEKTLKAIHKNLVIISNNYEKVFKSSSSRLSAILEVADMIYDLAERTDTITTRLDTFQSNIESLGSLIMDLQQQPLELDYLVFTSEDSKIPSCKQKFFKSLAFSIKKLVNSYVADYDTLNENQRLDVWISTGRDQAQIIERMINEDFSLKTNTKVKLSIVDTGTTLIQATLAGKGPDIALSIAQDFIVNLAMRDALVDITDYDFGSLRSQTTEAAWTPLYYNRRLYALPEAEVFDVIFYRTDIFNELGLDVPNTWDEFYGVIKALQSNSLEVGLQEINSANAGVSAGIATFNKLLFQRGGTYYNDDLSKTLFNTKVAYEAFTEWTEFYTVYGLDRDFNFFNRFRSGTMPIGITGYTQYGQLMGAAPEIRGNWSMALIPGTKNEDGSIDRTQSSSVTGCMILKKAESKKLKNEAVEFLKWWTSDSVQARYGNEIESMMGITARYSPSSLAAVKNLKWTKEELAILEESRSSIYNVPEVPGNYLIARSITSAFRDTVAGKNEPWRSLMIYNNEINSEIQRKREEFGLNK